MNYSRQASSYEKVIKEMKNKTDAPNFSEILMQKCDENEISLKQTKLIMGLVEFRAGKADPKYDHMREKSFSERKIEKDLINAKIESKIVKAMKIYFNIEGEPFHYYSKNCKENVFYFSEMLLFYLPCAKNVTIKIVDVHISSVNTLQIENQLMLLANNEANFYNF